MLPLFGNPKTLCNGTTRRDLLHVGGLGLLNFGLADYLRVHAGGGVGRSFGTAKSCILLFPYGSPAQHETFDPKPEAPAEVRGEMKAISSSVPGVPIGEGLPRVARILDRITVVRSVTHPYPVHGVAYAVNGMPTYTPDLETRPRDPRMWPFIGSVVDYLADKSAGGRLPAMPRNVGLPWALHSKADLLVNAGPYAAFLGQTYDPIWTDFDGPGTRPAPHFTQNQAKTYMDPYAGTTPAGRFRLSQESELPPDLPAARLTERRTLLEQFDHNRRAVDAAGAHAAFDKYRATAYTLLTTSKMRTALDIQREPTRLRESYGMTLFGQSCLAARRLVEAGSKFVTVFWDGYGQFANGGWDTHANHYPRLREYLLPGFDAAYSALITDLESRGLLDETLVMCLSEHGRTPRIDSKPKGAGRDHWSRVYSVALAGGGVPRGKSVGSSDRIAGDVRETPVSPKDLLATAFHLLGIDANTTVPDPQGRPVPIAGDGVVRPELLS